MDVRGYVEANARAFIDDLKQWLAIPSISADPDRHDDVRRSAEWLAGHLRGAGFGSPRCGKPRPAGCPRPSPNGRPRTRPPLPSWSTGTTTSSRSSRWRNGTARRSSPPSATACCWAGAPPTTRGRCCSTPSACAPALAASSADAPPVTIKLLVEGEEESGSEHFADLLRRERARLACDVIVISDTTMWAADVPSMCTGMRGLVPVEVTLTGPVRDLHSGSFGGGVPNPLHAMASLLAGLHDEQGRVTLPRFYDRVLPLSEEERDLLARLPFDEKQWLAEAGESGAAYGEQGFSTLERIWARPTAEVNGMWGGHTGPGSKTIIPRAAHAKISFRLVADQDPAEVGEAFREYVAAGTPDGLTATVTVQPGVRPCHSPITSPAVLAGRRAMQRAFGQQVLFTSEGGSGPEADLAEILAAPLVFVAVGLDSDQIHAPNESVDLSLLLRGAEVSAYLWDELAAADLG